MTWKPSPSLAAHVLIAVLGVPVMVVVAILAFATHIGAVVW